MKKLLLAFLVLCIGIVGMSRMGNNDKYDNKDDFSFDERLEHYIESAFSNGYYCDDLEGSKYFFDFVYFPYKKKSEYLVSFSLGGYTKTELGNITSCGGGGGILIVKDDGKKISLVHRFDEFKDKKLPKNVVKLLTSKEIEKTTYEQAKKYFDIDENKKISQKCPRNLCNKTWYHVIDNSKEKTDSNVFVYSTTPPKEMESASRRWTLNFVDNHDMTEIDRLCPNNENDGRCVSTGNWKIINKNTISYTLGGESGRSNRIELIEASRDTLKFVNLYE